MTTVKSFVERLDKIGVKVELLANYPWIYMDKVNGKKVKDRFRGEHGFTVFFTAIRNDDPHKEKITDISTIFKQIRKHLE